MLKRSSLLLFCIILAAQAYATHNRAGEIIYKQLSNFKYEVTIITYTKESSKPADRDSLTINWGDGTSKKLRRYFQQSLGNDIKLNKYGGSLFGVHTYNGPGVYKIWMEDPNRNADICNIPNSVNTTFYLESELRILDPQFFGFNNSPELLYPPIDFAMEGQVYTHNPAAYDVDGDSLTFELVKCKGIGGANISGYLYPDEISPGINNILSINSKSGELIWDSPPSGCCEYNICILIKEYRLGTYIGSVLRDMQIDVLCDNNRPPVIREFNDTCVVAGDTIDIEVFASEPDAGQTVTLSAVGGSFNVNASPSLFTINTGFDSVKSDYYWETRCVHVQQQPYIIVFKAEDNYVNGSGDPEPLVDVKTWVLRVVAPPPENLTATPIGNDIHLAWDANYACDTTGHFRGFSIWRKEGSNPFVPDSCETGLAGRGYSMIESGVIANTYIDPSLKRGNTYCYRLLAEFGGLSQSGIPYNTTKSIASNEACSQLKRDVPVITNVSVLKTAVDSGKIYVAWSKPLGDDLDTILNGPPYKYELRRCEGRSCNSGTLVKTFTANTFAQLNDTTFVDSLINTKDFQYTYYVDFYGNSTDYIGVSERATSIFISLTPNDNRLELTWNELVPWTNDEYYIYKYDTLIDMWYVLDTVYDQFYTDSNLINLEEYCYYITSYGAYSAPGFVDPILNNSQEACGIPQDFTPPCPPIISLDNDCNIVDDADKDYCSAFRFENRLSWTNPNVTCNDGTDDVVSYTLYFSSTDGGTFVSLDTLYGATNVSLIHDRIEEEAVAGCYFVTATDSFGNESNPSDTLCVDNCPCYRLPNVFTPNTDNSNDFFIPFPYRFVDKVNITIYNRWGNLVWESEDPDINWDGTDLKSGKAVANGVYFYVCELSVLMMDGAQESETLKGYVHVLESQK